MMLLIDREDFATYNRAISQSEYNKGNLNQYILDAQFVDLKGLLGSEFYEDIIRNSTSEMYNDLIDGSVYEYKGKTYTNYGLKSVLVYYSYARYVLNSANVDTPFGMVQKNNVNSTATSYQEKKSIFKMNQQIGYEYFKTVFDFLERNSKDFPLWKDDCQYSKTNTFRISKIG